MEQIQNGDFRYFGQDGDEIKALDLGEVTMKYIVDSKNYYQPVYSFDACVNGENEYEIDIPALITNKAFEK